MIRRFGRRFSVSRALGVAAVALATATVSCGPPLTDPATSNVSGTWFAAGPAAGFTNITVNLTQGSDGTISGTYSATSDPALQLCTTPGPCAVFGPVSGANTVFQVFFKLLGAGDFSGQLIDANELKGAMNRTDITQPIEFTKS
jgi:hypothetical protein